jgi:hypothetical protein
VLKLSKNNPLLIIEPKFVNIFDPLEVPKLYSMEDLKILTMDTNKKHIISRSDRRRE